MPLQFRRGHSDDLPLPSDAAVGEPLFTTNDGKLHIKKADGTFAEIGDGSASAIDLSGLATGSLVQVNAAQDGFDAATQISSSVTFATADETGFSNAVQTRLLEELPATEGVLDIAQQSTLEAFIADWPTDANGDLDIAQQSTLLTVQDDIDALDYLTAFFTDAALPATPGSTGFLKYDTSTSEWSLVASTATAPDEINGGNAASFTD